MLKSLSTESLRLVCCSAGGETYCLDMASVLSIERADFLQLNPGNDGPAGWLLGRPQETPVFSLAAQLGDVRTHQQYSHNNRVIVFKSLNAPWGLLVDSVSRLVEATVGDLLALPEIAKDSRTNSFLCAVKSGDRLMLFIDPYKLNSDAKAAAGNVPGVATTHAFASSSRISNLQESGNRGMKRHEEKEHPAGNGQGGKVLLFSTGSADERGEPVLFALSVRQILQIVDPTPVTPVPFSPRHIAGLFNWRNQVVPLVEIDCCLGGEPATADPRNRILIARAPLSGEPAGFRVRPGVRVEALPLDCKPETPNGQLDQSMVTAVFKAENHMLIVPDLDAMVSVWNSKQTDTLQALLPLPRSVAVG